MTNPRNERTRLNETFASETWLFAYGSLLFRPGFSPKQQRLVELRGYARRFWQGSPDHRGTPEAPGRVVTLVEAEGECVSGLAYLVPASDVTRIIAELDERERAGFVRRELVLTSSAGELEALGYVARPDNPHFLGPAPLDELAAQVVARRGPSGSNTEYVLRLARVLRELGLDDPHVFELEGVVSELLRR